VESSRNGHAILRRDGTRKGLDEKHKGREVIASKKWILEPLNQDHDQPPSGDTGDTKKKNATKKLY